MAKQLLVRHLCRIERDSDRLGVTSVAVAHAIIVRICCIASGVTGDGARYAFDVLKDSLNAPEAAAGKHDDLIVIRDAAEGVVARRCRFGGRYLGGHAE